MKHAYCLWPLRNPCDKNLQELRGTFSLYCSERDLSKKNTQKQKKTSHLKKQNIKRAKILQRDILAQSQTSRKRIKFSKQPLCILQQFYHCHFPTSKSFLFYTNIIIYIHTYVQSKLVKK